MEFSYKLEPQNTQTHTPPQQRLSDIRWMNTDGYGKNGDGYG